MTVAVFTKIALYLLTILLPENDFGYLLAIVIYSTYFFLVVGNIIFLIITGILMFRKSRRLENSEHTKFEYLKKWYWMCLQLQIILFTMWTIEAFSVRIKSSYYDAFSRSIAHFIFMYSSFLIFAIFMGRKNVRNLLLQKYRIF